MILLHPIHLHTNTAQQLIIRQNNKNTLINHKSYQYRQSKRDYNVVETSKCQITKLLEEGLLKVGIRRAESLSQCHQEINIKKNYDRMVERKHNERIYLYTKARSRIPLQYYQRR